MAETPIVPNTNVGSKLKEILAEKAPTNAKKNKPKGKWDEIMTQIAENHSKKPLKEVKSKVFADFKPPKLIRPNSNNGNKKILVAASTRSNSTLTSRHSTRSNSTLSSRHSRSTSSASVTSQLIREEIDDDDNISECTVKEPTKNRPSSRKGKISL